LGIEFRPLSTTFLAAGNDAGHEDDKDEKKVGKGYNIFHFIHVIRVINFASYDHVASSCQVFFISATGKERDMSGTRGNGVKCFLSGNKPVNSIGVGRP
jgi:hypothetical protein